MIKHIVMWRLLDEAQGNTKAKNLLIAKEKLESLNGKIPGLIHLEVGADFCNSEHSADLVLYSELESREALTVYQQHPDHVEVAQFVVAVCAERRVVDYEC